ncbi:MAG: ABC transporter substrate-binding protein [Dehalococcoidia bacterium]
MRKRELLTRSAEICLVLTVIVLALVGYTKASPTQEVTLPVGMIQPLSGPGAPWGTSILRSIEMGLQEVNEKGVIIKGVTYKFKLIAEDDKGFADVAVDRVKKLIERDKITLLLGSLYSAPLKAVAPFCADNKILHLATGYDKKNIAARNTYTFTAGIMTDFQLPGFIDYMAGAVPNIRKAVLVHSNDTTGLTGIAVTEPECKKRGWTTILAGHERGAIEFGPLASKISTAAPDVVFCVGTAPPDFFKISKASRDLGYKGPLCEMGGVVLSELYKVLGDKMNPVYVSEGVGEKPYANDELITFYSKYTKKYGVESWAVLAAIYYSWVKVYAQLLERTQSTDSTMIRDLLSTPGKDWYCVMGGKSYTVTERVAKEIGLESTRYLNVVWQASTWDDAAKKQVNCGWTYPYGWTGPKLPK